jgi:hyperosmotically inducible periplasmic protein
MNKPIAAFVILASVTAAPLSAQTPSSAAADNAKSNKVVIANSATADSQSNNATDLDLTKRIRQSVIADTSLSTYAHNVKIVTVNGSVTLNGVVRSENEKAALAKKASDIAGEGKVTNDLKVAPTKP